MKMQNDAEIIRMTQPQFNFVAARSQFPAFVGGFGSGKTEALVTRNLMNKLRYPTCNTAYYLPTFDLVRHIAFPRFEEKLTQYSIPYKLNKQQAVIRLENLGDVIFRTMDSPVRIIGYEVADSDVDELDTLKTDDAKAVWRKIIARNRQKKPDGSLNTVGVGTTPEGFRFVYDTWKKDPEANIKGYELFKASTYSNKRNLPDGYIESLIATYPENLILAYIAGEFVNLTSGSVYTEFSRELNNSTEQIISTDKEKENLHIGCDFNVGKMMAVIHVIRKDDPHATDELKYMLDTPAMINTIKEKYPKHPIIIYPDASGNARKTNNASESDISLLRQAGFTVMVNTTNPAVRDRILSMNACFNANKKRRYRVNVTRCPVYAEALEKQSYDKNGEPDKSSGFDHINDAGGYFISHRFPVIRQSSQRVVIGGI